MHQLHVGQKCMLVSTHTQYTNSFIPAKCNTGIELQWTLTCIQVDYSLFEFRFIEE